MGIVATVAQAAEPVTRTGTGEAVTFWLLGVLAVVGAVGVVAAAKAVYSALFLAMTMLILAVFYFVQDAMFLGVVQIVVYTGAVMMLFLFVMMLIGVDSAESLVETLRGQRIASVVAGLGFGVLLIAGIGAGATHLSAPSAAGPAAGQGNVEGLAELIFSRYLWAFELTGALLITAVLAAMVLAHRERLVARPTQRELSIRRFRHGGHPTPLPTPGVYARHNAVDIAALLPDGSFAELSVPSVLAHRTVARSGDARPAAGSTTPGEEDPR
ncbi:NADH-quinone oxidoreductase subunit J [Mycobacterium sp. 1274756.6]|uniref:NADH-quinone oxidoreductase subunit J n=1 Tax=Mycobacterium sp. 1274756.6 TaxID=1834076 RepID=UPI000801F1EE|nr:NADH-quinone oxidoreductase subunit J [Mycobacterium sp. 1274756.6]OBJ73179.1 NADH:ubiquinone oxidoreductase subunit J [Mycobacterium sp. 1274756.6]